jgi:hypothetical protein
VAVSAVAFLGMLVGTVVVFGGDDGHPSEWDARVVDLVDYVESERDLHFDHPVEVEFLSEDEYSARTRLDAGELSDDDVEAMEESSATLEALGLVPPGTDLLDTSNEMSDTGTLAFYDPTIETIVVRGTEMTTNLEVTLVHELVHAAQDQAFDLETSLAGDSAGAADAYRALVEGDASRVHTAYVGSLSADEQTEYWDEYAGAYEESAGDLDAVPGAFQALFAAPYALGQPLVEVIAEDGGNAGVDDAFRDPPASAEHLVDPLAYFDGDDPRDVDPPDVPGSDGAVYEPDELGAVALFVMLSERIDPIVALDAADGWGGDAAVTFDEDEDVCVRVNLEGDTAADTDEIAGALRAWADAGPAGAATVETAGDSVELESCTADGADAPESTDRSAAALGLVAMRSQFMVMGMAAQGLDRDEAFAFGDCAARRFPLDAVAEANETGELPPDVVASVDDIVADCIAG